MMQTAPLTFLGESENLLITLDLKNTRVTENWGRVAVTVPAFSRLETGITKVTTDKATFSSILFLSFGLTGVYPPCPGKPHLLHQAFSDCPSS